jgi:hypothetical protein
MTAIFGILESSATQQYQDVAPTQQFIFHCHVYSLWSGNVSSSLTVLPILIIEPDLVGPGLEGVPSSLASQASLVLATGLVGLYCVFSSLPVLANIVFGTGLMGLEGVSQVWQVYLSDLLENIVNIVDDHHLGNCRCKSSLVKSTECELVFNAFDPYHSFPLSLRAIIFDRGSSVRMMECTRHLFSF